MGCDIHLYIEYTEPRSDYVYSFGGRINPGRNYSIFTHMAGVRNYDESTQFIHPRGVPDKMGFWANCDHSLVIIDSEHHEEGCVSRSIADKWIAGGLSKLIEGRKRVTNPDHHSHSWLTLDEFSRAVALAGGDFRYGAIVAAMTHLEENGCTTRVVFWFDN